MKPPRQISIRERTDHELAQLAQRAVYLGSHEHKNQKRAEWQTTTICPLTTETDRIRATGWVKIAIKSRQCRFSQEDKNFPKWIWHEADGQFWMGYLVVEHL